MRLPEIGLKYPITTAMIFVAVILLGLVSLSRIGLDLMPDIEIPVISVMTTYQGAGPEEIESKITEVLEERLATVKNVDKIEASSQEGISIVSLKFDWGINLDEASNDVRDMVGLAKRELPEEADEPIVFKFDLSMMPIMVIAFTAEESYAGLYDIIDERVVEPLKTVPGVAAAMIRGGLEREIQVELDRWRLEAYNLSTEQITKALKDENLSIPGGHIKTGKKDYLIRTPEELGVKEIEKIVLATTKDGSNIYLKDVATVKDAYKEQTQIVQVDRRPGLILLVQKQSGTNTVAVAKRVYKKLDEIRPTLPKDVNMKVMRDLSDFIEGSLENLRSSLYLGICLVVIILFLFFTNIRAGLIVACSIPTSLIVAFVLLYLGKYTLNIISVSSLAIAMGMVVDAAIVVIDNIYRHLENGQTKKEAAVSGANEVAMAISASTLTTIAVFVPLIFVGGVTGIFFKEMAYVISVTLVSSLVCALLLIPMLGNQFLKFQTNEEIQKKGALYKFSQKSHKVLNKIDFGYSKLLGWALSNRKKVIFSAIILLIASLLLLPFIGTKFMPETDSNMFRMFVEMPVGTRAEETGKVMQKIQEIIEKNVPERIGIFGIWGYSSSGGGRAGIFGTEGSHLGTVGARLVPKEERKRLSKDIVADLRPLMDFPGAKIRFDLEDPLSGMMFAAGKTFVIELYGYDLNEGMRLAQKVEDGLKTIPGIVDLEISRKVGKPELQVIVDRNRASSLGLNVSNIGRTIETYFSGRPATKYRERGKEYDIFVRLKEENRKEIQDVKNAFIISPTGEKIRLSNIAQIIEESGPIEIERKNQQRIIKVMANLEGIDLGSAARLAKEKIANINIPKGFFLNFGGEREEQEEAFALLRLALLLGITLVYMVMASQFESLRDPFIILFSIPFALIGVLWSHFIFNLTFNIDSFIGLILLVGIVVNNAIVLISFIGMLRKRGLGIKEAVMEGGRLRLRPILTTTLTTIFGLLPLVFSKGEGSEEWLTLGLTVVSGLSFSTLITLILIPTLYSIFEERRRIVPNNVV